MRARTAAPPTSTTIREGGRRPISPFLLYREAPEYNRIMPIAVVGSVAYDGVETPHGKVDRMLGGACTYIALAAAYFTPVKIVGVVGDDFAQEDYDLLASRKIDLEGL